jgi:hypothetical protein
MTAVECDSPIKSRPVR